MQDCRPRETRGYFSPWGTPRGRGQRAPGSGGAERGFPFGERRGARPCTTRKNPSPLHLPHGPLRLPVPFASLVLSSTSRDDQLAWERTRSRRLLSTFALLRSSVSSSLDSRSPKAKERAAFNLRDSSRYIKYMIYRVVLILGNNLTGKQQIMRSSNLRLQIKRPINWNHIRL